MKDPLLELIELIDRFDNLGKLDRKLPLFAIAIGTLRKDRQIGDDIFALLAGQKSGFGALALSRILVEDYFYLRYLAFNPDRLSENLELFNSHPNIDHYASMKSMKTWGYKFSEEEASVIPSLEQGFETVKDKFLRPGKQHEPYDADNYFRTWTRLNLDSVIAKCHFDEEDQSTIHFLNENYNFASSLIHHNAFNIWFLATQGGNSALTNSGYNDIAYRVTFIVLNRQLKLVLDIYGKEEENQSRALEYLLKLEKILDRFNNVVPK